MVLGSGDGKNGNPNRVPLDLCTGTAQASGPTMCMCIEAWKADPVLFARPPTAEPEIEGGAEWVTCCTSNAVCYVPVMSDTQVQKADASRPRVVTKAFQRRGSSTARSAAVLVRRPPVCPECILLCCTAVQSPGSSDDCAHRPPLDWDDSKEEPPLVWRLLVRRAHWGRQCCTPKRQTNGHPVHLRAGSRCIQKHEQLEQTPNTNERP